MGRYLHFLSKTYFKKAGPYINMIFGAGAFLAIMMPLISSANSEGGTGISSINTFTKFFPFLFSTLFSAISVNHIFKEGEIDGSELIVVAKPLTRAQIIITKFLMLFLVIGMYQLLATVTYMIAAASDDFATSEQKMKFVASLAVGGLIVQVIAAMVIVMISSVLGKVGTTVVSILFAAIVPIISFTLAPLGKGQAFSFMNPGMVRNTFTMKDNDENNITTSSDNVYYNIELPQDKQSFKDYEGKIWYDKAAYGDVWYQWGRFYSMFTDSRNNESLVQRWKYQETKVVKGNSIALKVKIDATHTDEWIVTNRANIKDRDVLAKDISEGYKFYTNPANSGDLATLKTQPLNSRLNMISSQVHTVTATPVGPTTYLAATMIEYKLQQLKTYTLPTTIAPQPVSNGHPAIIATNDYHSVMNEEVELYKVGATIKTLVQEDFISTTAVTLCWSVIAVLLIGGSMIIFFRRDFK